MQNDLDDLSSNNRGAITSFFSNEWWEVHRQYDQIMSRLIRCMLKNYLISIHAISKYYINRSTYKKYVAENIDLCS